MLGEVECAKGVNMTKDYLLNVTEISKLQLKPGDILVVKVSGRAAKGVVAKIAKYFEDVIPSDASVRVVNDEIFDFLVVENGKDK